MAAYATNTEVKTYLNVTGNGDDALLTTLISRAQQYIDSYTRRTFSSTGNTTRNFTVGVDTEGRMLWLDQDLCSINAVTTDADGDTPSTVASGEYITHPRNRTPYYGIEIRSDANESWTYSDTPETGITVSGKWGYSTAPPEDVKHACIRLAAFYYRQKDAQVFDTTALPGAGVVTVPIGVPNDVKLILDLYRRQHTSLVR